MSQLPELLQRQAVKRLDRFCTLQAQHQQNPRRLEYRIDGEQINLFELRRCQHNPRHLQQLPIAQLRFSTELSQWTLHHQNGQHWQLYLNVTPSLDLGKLLVAIQQDPMGCFWPD